MDQESTEQLARLWTQAQPVVASYVLSLVRDFHLAEDILQQVAVILVREFEKYDPARPFLPWSLGIAKNVVLKSRRDMARDSSRLLDSELVDRLQAAFEQDLEVWGSLRQALHACLQQQKGRLQEALQWRYSQDLKPQSIAEKMGTTAGAVRVMLHRARAVLRECIRRRLSAGA
ncbi:MAG TPA: sigma-70 family RNA polymerase sigma factor [Pirellulales bacterium]|jgi:RNA polymerase sigma-70 factor (ECF subfamily)